MRARVVAPLITAALISLVTTIIPGGWLWVFARCRVAWIWFVSAVTVPMWLLALLSLLSLALLGTIVVGIFFAIRRGESDILAKYREDTLFGIHWRWRYGQDGIYNLHSFCPHCDMQVYPHPVDTHRPGDWVEYRCDDCGAKLQSFECGQSELQDRVTRKIQQKVRREMCQQNGASA
jgi:hypothetical protein